MALHITKINQNIVHSTTTINTTILLTKNNKKVTKQEVQCFTVT